MSFIRTKIDLSSCIPIYPPPHTRLFKSFRGKNIVPTPRQEAANQVLGVQLFFQILQNFQVFY